MTTKHSHYTGAPLPKPSVEVVRCQCREAWKSKKKVWIFCYRHDHAEMAG